MPKMAMVFAIAASVLGQVTGSRAERYVVKSVAQKKMTLAGPNVSSVEATHMQFPRFSSDGRYGYKAINQFVYCFEYIQITTNHLHAAVPFIGILRKSVLMPKMAMLFTIAASVTGQVIGSRAERYRLKSVAQKKMTLSGSPNPSSVEATQTEFPGVSSDGRCGDKVVMKWNPMFLEAASPVSTGATNVVC
ncbi:BnaA03g47080D [Brassica napus]|uniref:(rape) hypothetical protein n=1 Tax=Brassica napus TaxID=3708 RepID=A0A078FDQ9_BRANA|nr:unnamed protein product [Brassica napus]CDY11049.1 BnaA03g47080D [Brassica napus]